MDEDKKKKTYTLRSQSNEKGLICVWVSQQIEFQCFSEAVDDPLMLLGKKKHIHVGEINVDTIIGPCDRSFRRECLTNSIEWMAHSLKSARIKSKISGSFWWRRAH